ncbi:polysaccharide biosynthesis/export family protein [Qipengyuania sediminis]|uniref:polysaccharide biosynthesis/export family protein n=1 Tax=Qipengyuania sediminis TaxID=1532023 RepID=UPI001F0F8A6C|nr:polysaccharide biosynthesis/export family protein [Qipengyuania sediminis]
MFDAIKTLNALKGTTLSVCLAIAGLAGTGMAQAQAPAQAANSQPANSAAQPTPSVSTYRINPGDELEIYVWGEERLQRQLKVLPDGTIAFPLVGQLRVEGQMPQDVERMVSARLREQYRGDVPFVTVSVRAPAGMRFSVLGKVKSPGVFDTGRYVNVLEALGQAGGPDEFANLDGVTVIRGSGANAQAFRVRVGSIFRAGVDTRDVRNANLIQIAPGDVIIVP